MTHFEALQVHLELAGATVFVGHAQFQRRRGALASTTFQYDLGYLAHPDAYPIDPAFDLFSGTQHTQGLPGAFADSAPDWWGRNLIKKRERALARAEGRRPQELDDADFLAGACSDISPRRWRLTPTRICSKTISDRHASGSMSGCAKRAMVRSLPIEQAAHRLSMSR